MRAEDLPVKKSRASRRWAIKHKISQLFYHTDLNGDSWLARHPMPKAKSECARWLKRLEPAEEWEIVEIIAGQYVKENAIAE